MKKHLLFAVILCSVVILHPGSVCIAKDKKQPAVMLANKWMPAIDIKGWWLSEKLDGVRGCWTGTEMLSRSGKKIQVPKWFTKNFPPFPLDGELWTDRKSFSEIISIVKTNGNEKRWEKVCYYIFDVPIHNVPFEKRIDKAKDWYNKNHSLYGKVLEQKICLGRQHLSVALKKIEDAGGEGIMLRRPGSFYSTGRSSDILKVKTFHDADGIVIKHLKGKGRNSNRMGSVLVKLPDGKRFLIGSGFTDVERENPPPIGSTITFKYKEINKSGIPRFASYLRARQEL